MEVDRKLTMDTSIAKINLDNLRHNIREYQTLLGETTKIIAVIKADAYGHGVLPVYRAAKEEGIDFFAVSRIKEGIELVKAGDFTLRNENSSKVFAYSCNIRY